jgi:plasmid stabilization system protein ParE
MTVIWIKRAKQDYFNVLEYLHENWGVEAVSDFVVKTNNAVRTIASNSNAFIASTKRKNVHKGFVTRHNVLFYQVKSRTKDIVLLFLGDKRQDSLKLQY